MRLDGRWRVTRGALVGLSIMLVSVAGHAAVGGLVPYRSPAFAGLTVLAISVAVVMSDREWTGVRLLALLAIAQLVIHAGLAVRLTDPGHSGTAMGMQMGSGPASGTLMLAGHIAAVIVLAVVLRRGERWLLKVRDKVASVLPRRSRRRRPPLLLWFAPTVPSCSVSPLFAADEYEVHRRRGPPRSAIAYAVR